MLQVNNAVCQSMLQRVCVNVLCSHAHRKGLFDLSPVKDVWILSFTCLVTNQIFYRGDFDMGKDETNDTSLNNTWN